MNKPYIELLDGTNHVLGEPFTPNIEVIARALSRINRYTGHAGGLSVAQHCVMCCFVAPMDVKLSALLHDAHEAYIGDMSAPLKQLIPQYCDLEQFYHDQIDAHYGVETRHEKVKAIDLRMLVTEAKTIGMKFYEEIDATPYSNDDLSEVFPWPPAVAEQRFLNLFKELTK